MMNLLPLCIVLYILIADVKVYGSHVCIPRLGEECSRYRTCCDGDCVEGTCVRSPSCKNFKCPDGQKCFIPAVTCKPAGVCIIQAQCRDKIKTIEENICKKVDCAQGYKCMYRPVKCTVKPCLQGQAQCVLENPCAFVNCTYPNTCIRNINNPTEAECVYDPRQA